MTAPAIHGTLLALGAEPLPTVHGDFVVHRFHNLAAQHAMLVVTIGDVQASGPLPARVHSSCVTSEAYGGCDCDCAEQLDATLAHLAGAGRGAVFYLTQEGRGAGFVAKARDRMLVQASGQRLTTFDAYACLGLPDDQRRYGEVAAVMRLLGMTAPLTLLTNNPAKVRALVDEGIVVAGTAPFTLPASPYNRHYLAAKSEAGHRLRALDGDAAVPPGPVAVAFEPHVVESAPRFVRLASYLLPVRLTTAPVWFRMQVYFDTVRGVERVVLVLGADDAACPLVRVQPELLLERFPVRAPTHRSRWRAAAAAIAAHGAGRVLFVPAADAGDAAAADLLATHVAARARMLVDGAAPTDGDAALAAALVRRGVATEVPLVLEAAA
jgi:GTP cyclohydrolase II